MIKMNIAIISSSSEKPLQLWIADRGLRIFERHEVVATLAVDEHESTIRNPKCQIDLPVTVFLSVERLAVSCRPNVENIYLIPVIRVLILI